MGLCPHLDLPSDDDRVDLPAHGPAHRQVRSDADRQADWPSGDTVQLPRDQGHETLGPVERIAGRVLRPAGRTGGRRPLAPPGRHLEARRSAAIPRRHPLRGRHGGLQPARPGIAVASRFVLAGRAYAVRLRRRPGGDLRPRPARRSDRPPCRGPEARAASAARPGCGNSKKWSGAGKRSAGSRRPPRRPSATSGRGAGRNWRTRGPGTRREPRLSRRIFTAISLPVGGIAAGPIQINGEARRHIWQIFRNYQGVALPNSFFAVRAQAGRRRRSCGRCRRWPKAVCGDEVAVVQRRVSAWAGTRSRSRRCRSG